MLENLSVLRAHRYALGSRPINPLEAVKLA